MKNIWITIVFFIGFLTLASAHGQSVSASQSQQSQKRIGVLLLAHGGSVQEWDEDVRHVADRVDLSLPIEVAFGMATRSTMQAAINRLGARGVTEIVAVPLFISSHSSLIDSTAYLLGLRAQAPEDLKMFASMDHDGAMDHSSTMDHSAMQAPDKTADSMKPVISPVPIRMASALDHHRIVADILKDRAASISKHPKREIVVLVAHGPVPEDENKLWLDDMNILAAEMRKHTHYAGIECITLRDDADAPVRDAATRQLREKVQQIDAAGKTALVVPLLLSYGGIENGLRKRLTGLAYKMPSQGLLPDDRIAEWVIETAQNTATDFKQHTALKRQYRMSSLHGASVSRADAA